MGMGSQCVAKPCSFESIYRFAPKKQAFGDVEKYDLFTQLTLKLIKEYKVTLSDPNSFCIQKLILLSKYKYKVTCVRDFLVSGFVIARKELF